MCSYTPRFSYGCPKLTVSCGTSVSWVHRRGWYRVRAGWVYRVGIQGGYTGGVPSQVPTPSGGMYSGAGPGSPTGAGVGGTCCSAHGTVRPSTQTHHSGPKGPPGPLRWSGPSPRANAASGPITARFSQFYGKLVKTA